MTSEGQTMLGGSLTTRGIPTPTKPVVHQRPTAMDRLQRKETK